MAAKFQNAAFDYSFAVLAVAIATYLRWWLERLFGPMPIFVTLYPAVLLVAAIARTGAAILSIALAALAADYYFIPPYGFGIESPNDMAATAIFTLANVFLCLLMMRMRRANWERAVATTRAEALRKANEELNRRVYERTAQIRALALELGRAEQRERKRLAQVLHDHLQQLLVGARWNLDAVRGRAGKEAGGQLDAVENLLNEAIADSRSLAVELSPPVLRESGLVAAMNWLGRWMAEKHGFNVEVEAGDEIPPDTEGICVLLFQCVRELLFNSVKHSGVKTASVRIVRAGNELQITVADNGAGFDPASMQDGSGKPGFGLYSIRERMLLISGRMEIESATGRGARFTLFAPMPAPAAPKQTSAAANS
ncbi:sensor histidine kinase [bacterium]|nr:sensor histidine kinase [bacterium]